MAQVFISYASEDRSRVIPLVEAIEAEGISVWWDRQIGTGRSFDREIERQLEAADCIVVVWSESSIESDWVRVEAMEGFERGILLPLQIDDVRLPLAFRGVQTASFLGWPDNLHQIRIAEFVQAIRSIVRKGLSEANDSQVADLYLRIRHERSNWSPENLERAIRSFQNGIELLGHHALFECGIGETLWQLAHNRPGELHEYLKKAEASATRTLELDPDLPQGHILSWLIDYRRGRNTVLRDIERLVNDNPSNVEVLMWAPFVFVEAGIEAPVDDWLRRSIEADPLNPLNHWAAGYCALLLGDIDRAIKATNRSLSIEPTSTTAIVIHALLEAYRGRKDAAITELSKLRTIRTTPDHWMYIGNALASALIGEVPQIPDLVESELRTDETWAWIIADCFAFAGDFDSALDWLNNAKSWGFLNAKFLETTDVSMVAIRQDQRFISLLGSMRSRNPGTRLQVP